MSEASKIAFGFDRLKRSLAVALLCWPVAAGNGWASDEVDFDGGARDFDSEASNFFEVENPTENPATARVTAARTAPRSWLPTTPGTRTTYHYVQERSRSVAGRETETEQLRGTLIDEVVAADSAYGKGVVRVDSKVLAKNTTAKSELTESHSSYYRFDGSRIELVAERSADPTHATDLVTHYEVPLAIFEAGAEPGQRWEVGVRSQRDLHTHLEGEVLGVQAADTPAGHFEQCLVIRLTGEISGVVEAYGTRMEVPSGEVTMTRWYAPGHGLVLAKEQRRQTLILDDGTEMNYSERTQFALRSAEVPEPSVAPASPAAASLDVAP